MGTVMKVWALLNTETGTVQMIHPGPGEAEMAPVGEGYEWVDVTGIDPMPAASWTYDGTTFSEPVTDVNRKTLVGKMQGARNSNANFMGLSSPTNAQLAAQVKSLTRQVNALMRITANELDTIDDT
jgi:hypothetical protein